METNETVVTDTKTKIGGINAPITIVILILISMGIFYGILVKNQISRVTTLKMEMH